jgi:hypothetical protein
MACATPQLKLRGAGFFVGLLCTGAAFAFGTHDPRWMCDARPTSSMCAGSRKAVGIGRAAQLASTKLLGPFSRTGVVYPQQRRMHHLIACIHTVQQARTQAGRGTLLASGPSPPPRAMHTTRFVNSTGESTVLHEVQYVHLRYSCAILYIGQRSGQCYQLRIPGTVCAACRATPSEAAFSVTFCDPRGGCACSACAWLPGGDPANAKGRADRRQLFI